MRHLCQAKIILTEDEDGMDYDAVCAPFAEAFDENPPCGKPAVDYHGDSKYRVWLCARHWDQYVSEFGFVSKSNLIKAGNE